MLSSSARLVAPVTLSIHGEWNVADSVWCLLIVAKLICVPLTGALFYARRLTTTGFLLLVSKSGLEIGLSGRSATPFQEPLRFLFRKSKSGREFPKLARIGFEATALDQPNGAAVQTCAATQFGSTPAASFSFG